MTEMSTTYQAGDEIDINGTTITLIARRGFRRDSGIRWSWAIPAADLFSESSHTTAEDTIANAYRTLGTLCACGEPATMNASTRPTCAAHYDRYAD